MSEGKDGIFRTLFESFARAGSSGARSAGWHDPVVEEGAADLFDSGREKMERALSLSPENPETANMLEAAIEDLAGAFLRGHKGSSSYLGNVVYSAMDPASLHTALTAALNRSMGSLEKLGFFERTAYWLYALSCRDADFNAATRSRTFVDTIERKIERARLLPGASPAP